MNLAIFCTQLTFDLILRLGVIFRLGIYPSVFSYILRNTFSMDAKMYSKMPTEIFFGSSDCLLLGHLKAKMKYVPQKQIYFGYVQLPGFNRKTLPDIIEWVCAYKNTHILAATHDPRTLNLVSNKLLDIARLHDG